MKRKKRESPRGHGKTHHHRSRFARYVPHPLLTLVLVALWAALWNSFEPGVLLMGLGLGIVIPIYTAHFWPERPAIRRPWLAAWFLVILIVDIVIANIQVAYWILFRPAKDLQGRWIAVPLEITSPEAITALSATITLTPGTVASDLAADGRTLLVHCLVVDDEQAMVRRIKTRYERRIGRFLP